MSVRSQLQPEQIEALRARVVALIHAKPGGSQSSVARDLEIPQPTIGKLVKDGRVGYIIAQDIAAKLGTTLDKIVEEHRAKKVSQIADAAKKRDEKFTRDTAAAIEREKSATTAAAKPKRKKPR